MGHQTRASKASNRTGSRNTEAAFALHCMRYDTLRYLLQVFVDHDDVAATHHMQQLLRHPETKRNYLASW